MKLLILPRHRLGAMFVAMCLCLPLQSFAGDSATQRIRIEIKPRNEMQIETNKNFLLSPGKATTPGAKRRLSTAESSFQIHSNSANNKKITGELLSTADNPATGLRLHISVNKAAENSSTQKILQTGDNIALSLQSGMQGGTVKEEIHYGGFIANCDIDSNLSDCNKPLTTTIRLTLMDE